MKPRNRSIDIAKGILILLVVLGHVVQAPFFYGIRTDFYNLVEDGRILFTPFYMSAFFIVSGFCSSFNKTIFGCLKVSLKKILFPALVFSVLFRMVLSLYFLDFSYIKEFASPKYWLMFGDYWFLNALFFSKIFVTFLVKLFGKWYWILLFSFPLLLIGVYTSNNYGIVIFQKYYSFENYFCYKHCFIAVFFVSVGYAIKSFSDNKYYNFIKYVALIYIIGLLSLIIFHCKIPSYAYTIDVNNILIFILLSICGTGLVVFLSKKVDEGTDGNNYIEFYGRNSLIIYGINLPVLYLVYDIIIGLFNYKDSGCISVVAFIITLFLSMLIMTLIIVLYSRLCNQIFIHKHNGE